MSDELALAIPAVRWDGRLGERHLRALLVALDDRRGFVQLIPSWPEGWRPAAHYVYLTGDGDEDAWTRALNDLAQWAYFERRPIGATAYRLAEHQLRRAD